MCEFNNGPPAQGGNQLRDQVTSRTSFSPQFSKTQKTEWFSDLSHFILSIYKAISPKLVLRFRVCGPNGWQVDFHWSIE